MEYSIIHNFRLFSENSAKGYDSVNSGEISHRGIVTNKTDFVSKPTVNKSSRDITPAWEEPVSSGMNLQPQFHNVSPVSVTFSNVHFTPSFRQLCQSQ